MKIISLNHSTNNVEVFHLTDEYKKWLKDHDMTGDEDGFPFNDFMVDFFRSLRYSDPEFKDFLIVEDDETAALVEVYPEEHIDYII